MSEMSPGRTGPRGRDAQRRLPDQEMSSARKLVLNLLLSVGSLVVFFSGVELMLALAGVQPILVESDPYVGFQSSIRLYEVSESGDDLQTAGNKLEFFNAQRFPRIKAEGTSRVFTLGGSTTYGRPYDDRTSFSAWLREYLRVVDPSRRWEVINAGGISYASYRVALLMEELVDYEPDLFIIYSGNNEFLERRTYSQLIAEPVALTKTRLLLQKSRLWAVGRRATSGSEGRALERYELGGEVRELLNQSFGLDYYHRDAEFKSQVLDHYRFNLRRMVSLAQTVGARVILVTVPANESDFSPFKSEHRDGLSSKRQSQIAGDLERARLALDAENWEESLRLVDRALEADSLYAETHYLRGRALMGLERDAEAGSSFARAIAEDVCPLRALEEANWIIAETAERSNSGFVDFRSILKEAVESRLGHRSLGDESFLDHVHPTVEVHGDLAAALVDEMGAMGLLDLGAEWYSQIRPFVAEEIRSRVEPELTARAHKNLAKVLIWAGKNREAEKYVRLAEEVLEADWEVHFNAATVAMRERGDHRTALVRLQKALELRPDSARVHDLLAVVHMTAGDWDKALEAGIRAVRLDPEMVLAWSNLSIYYRMLGNVDAALSAARQALSLDPNSAESLNNLGNVYRAKGELHQALASYQEAIALRKNFPEAKTNAGMTLGALQRYAEAEDHFRDVVANDPDAVMARLGLAQTLLIRGKPHAALEHIEKVLERDPQSVKAGELRGYALEEIASANQESRP